MRSKLLSLILSVVFLVAFVFSCSEDKNPANQGDEGLIYNAGMVLVESAGETFTMGSVNGFADEQPVHNVTFTQDFWMDTIEVAQGDYDALMSASYTGYFTPTWQPTFGEGDNYPVYSVYWGDAVLYCNARSRSEGLDSVYTYSAIIGIPGSLCELQDVAANFSKDGYRLPTEAEWEFACRAETTTDFYWGKNYNPYPATTADTTEISGYAVWSANSWIFGVGNSEYGSHPVAAKTPNAFGLYDISGNLSEWCHDWYGNYSAQAQTDPAGPDSGNYHSVRGGNWGNNAEYLRSANRTFTSPDYLYYFLGFRCVRRY